MSISHLSDYPKVGTGSKGYVSRAYGSKTLSFYAVKHINTYQAAGLTSDREFEIIEMPKHPALIELDGTRVMSMVEHVFVMPFMPGGNLDTLIQQLSLSKRPVQGWDRAQEFIVAYGIADALRTLHTQYPRPVVHRDLQPKNIYLDEKLEPHLSDYGISRFEQYDGQISPIVDSSAVYFRDPELGFPSANGHNSTATDVFSFATILYFMSKYEPPFYGNSPDLIRRMYKEGQRPELEDDWKEIRNACWKSLQSERPSMKRITKKIFALAHQVLTESGEIERFDSYVQKLENSQKPFSMTEVEQIRELLEDQDFPIQAATKFSNSQSETKFNRAMFQLAIELEKTPHKNLIWCLEQTGKFPYLCSKRRIQIAAKKEIEFALFEQARILILENKIPEAKKILLDLVSTFFAPALKYCLLNSKKLQLTTTQVDEIGIFQNDFYRSVIKGMGGSLFEPGNFNHLRNCRSAWNNAMALAKTMNDTL